MTLVVAFKVEEDLQQAWREEREQEIQAEVEREHERRSRMKPKI